MTSIFIKFLWQVHLWTQFESRFSSVTNASTSLTSAFFSRTPCFDGLKNIKRSTIRILNFKLVSLNGFTSIKSVYLFPLVQDLFLKFLNQKINSSSKSLSLIFSSLLCYICNVIAYITNIT